MSLVRGDLQTKVMAAARARCAYFLRTNSVKWKRAAAPSTPVPNIHLSD
jgi:hypothetical protein